MTLLPPSSTDAEPIPGLVISSGEGILHEAMPPGLEVAQAIRPWGRLPGPDDAAQWVVDQVEWMVEADIDPIMVVGSSKGGPPVVLAAALRPELFSSVGSIVLVSTSAGERWGRDAFAESYSGDVLQMVGGGERETLIRAMMNLQKQLGTRCVAGQSFLNVYGDEKHGFLGSHAGARRDLVVWSLERLGIDATEQEEAPRWTEFQPR